jgi:hypothetical protein
VNRKGNYGGKSKHARQNLPDHRGKFNSGLGYETALALAKMDAHVIIVCRNRVKGEAAQAEIKSKSGNSSVDLLIADL